MKPSYNPNCLTYFRTIGKANAYDVVQGEYDLIDKRRLFLDSTNTDI